MLIEIKCRFTAKVLYSGEHADIKAAVEAAYLAGANLAGANLAWAYLDGANLDGAKGNISNSHELLAQFAIRFDVSLSPVAAMIAGRLVGCWKEYTSVIRAIFGEDVMRRLWQAWSQDESWGVVEKMKEHGWPEPDEVAAVYAPVLRERDDLGVDNDGKFRLSYRCCCQDCGFTFEHKIELEALKRT